MIIINVNKLYDCIIYKGISVFKEEATSGQMVSMQVRFPGRIGVKLKKWWFFRGEENWSAPGEKYMYPQNKVRSSLQQPHLCIESHVREERVGEWSYLTERSVGGWWVCTLQIWACLQVGWEAPILNHQVPPGCYQNWAGIVEGTHSHHITMPASSKWVPLLIPRESTYGWFKLLLIGLRCNYIE